MDVYVARQAIFNVNREVVAYELLFRNNNNINELKKWVFIIILQNLHENTEDELFRISLIRASFGELLSRKLEKNISSFDMFLTVMFSLIDALLNKKNLFYELLILIIEYEKGNWDIVNDLSKSFGLSEKVISDCYLEAIESLENFVNI